MSGTLIDALRSIAERVVLLAEDDPELRANLQELASAILEAMPETTEHVVSVASPVEAKVPAAEEPEMEYIPASVAVKSLWPSDVDASATSPASEHEAAAHREHWTPPDESDLALIETRCRLKSEGARWAASRRRQLADGADFQYEIAPLDRELIDRAREIENCYLWMNSPHAPMPESLELLDGASACFETTADAVALVRTTLEIAVKCPELFESSLDFLAEAQSALRAAVQQMDGPTDHDQQAVFKWLKYTGNANQIYIQRYMRVDDPADPANSDNLSARIEALDDRVQQVRAQEKKRRKLLNKIRYEAKRVRDGGDDAEIHLNTLIGTVDELVSDGVPPSNSQLRELLLPVVDEFSEIKDVTANVELVLREIDRYLASLSAEQIAPDGDKPTKEVQEVAQLLVGKAVFFIGGTRYSHAHDALKDAFRLSELIWFDTKEHESNEKFKPHVAREDVAVVLLAIRWSSHSYGDMKEFCEHYGKPLVRLPAGYNPNQVAVQILEQAGERLAQMET